HPSMVLPVPIILSSQLGEMPDGDALKRTAKAGKATAAGESKCANAGGRHSGTFLTIWGLSLRVVFPWIDEITMATTAADAAMNAKKTNGQRIVDGLPITNKEQTNVQEQTQPQNKPPTTGSPK